MRYLVIPLLTCAVSACAASYTTYIGDAYSYQVAAIAADGNGNTYITGSRVVLPSVSNPVTDVFVSKLDASGNLTLLATFSGKASDQANGIALDAPGNIYIVGTTTSPDFPLHHPLQASSSSGTTGFLIKLTPDGSMVYATFLGGTQGISSLNGVAADSQGYAYVTGTTQAADYPHTPGMPAGAVSPPGPGGPISGAFFAKIDPVGSQIPYAGTLSTTAHDCGGGSTCFLGSVSTGGGAIAVDPAGNAYIAGNSGGSGLPTTDGALLTNGIGAFVAKVNAEGTGLGYLTYLGTANYFPGVAPSSNPGNTVHAIVADADGNAYICGSTSDPAFPATASAFQTKLDGQVSNPFAGPPADAFVAKLNPAGSAMVWATFLGGSGPDSAQSVGVDSGGNVWVSGTTGSRDFPASGWPNGGEFLAELNSTGTALTYAELLPVNTVATALAVDAGGSIHAGGGTGLISAFSPGAAPGQTSAPVILGLANSAGGALGGRLAPGALISIYGLNLGPATPASATFDAAGFLPTNLAGVAVTIDGQAAPLLYVSATQINAVAPVELTAGSATALAVSAGGVALPDFRTVADFAAPQVFRNADGSAAAINQDGTVNSKSNPAASGAYVSVWATGSGYFPGSDGQMATTANSFCSAAGYCNIVDAAGDAAIAPYIGAAPGTVNGVVQINFQVSGDAPAYYFTVVGIDGGNQFSSDAFTVYVKP